MLGSDVSGWGFFTKARGTLPTITYTLTSKTLKKHVISIGNMYTNFLKEAFRNVTVSTRYGLARPNCGTGQDFSKGFGVNLSSVMTNATITIQRNEFSSKPRALVISYALSTFGAAVCLSFGLYAIHHNKGSFSRDFSTLFRIAKTQMDIMKWDVTRRRAKTKDKKILYCNQVIYQQQLLKLNGSTLRSFRLAVFTLFLLNFRDD